MGRIVEWVKCSYSISLENRKMLLKICMEHSHVWMWNLDDWKSEAFEMGCYRRMMNIKWIDRITNEELKLKESVIEELCERVRGREEVRWWGKHWDTGDCLGISWRGRWERKKRGRGCRLEYFDQITGNMGCESFREVKELTWNRAEWRLVAVPNQS